MNHLLTSPFFLAAALLLSTPASAAGSGWTSRGLEGRAIGSLVVDPSNPSRIYAAAGLDGVYRTADGGQNWSRVNIGQFVEKLAIDAQEPDTLYAVAGSRFKEQLFKSLDRGRTWTKVNSQRPVYSVAVDPRKPGLLYAGHDAATVSTSRDGGAPWSSSQFAYYCSDFCEEAITSLALDLSSPRRSMPASTPTSITRASTSSSRARTGARPGKRATPACSCGRACVPSPCIRGTRRGPSPARASVPT